MEKDPYVVVSKKNYQMLVNSSTYNQRAIREIKTTPASYVYASGYVQAEIDAEKGKITDNPYEDVLLKTIREYDEDIEINMPKFNLVVVLICVVSADILLEIGKFIF